MLCFFLLFLILFFQFATCKIDRPSQTTKSKHCAPANQSCWPSSLPTVHCTNRRGGRRRRRRRKEERREGERKGKGRKKEGRRKEGREGRREEGRKGGVKDDFKVVA